MPLEKPDAMSHDVVILAVMNQFVEENNSCPVGISDCGWVQQVSDLKSEITELQMQVSTDPLTGLYNYRYFESMLNNEMQRSNRTGHPTALIMVDLDLFKQVNDRWGHEGGNQALQLAATVFRQELRVFDIICRYGGEEFALILPHTVLEMAIKVAERVRQVLAQTPVSFGDQCFNITASLGIAMHQANDSQDMKRFVDQADQYLYQAKENGRNQVCYPDLATEKPLTSVSAEERAALFASLRED
jgi:diguanylate cyclase (GGDEF)-like protein